MDDAALIRRAATRIVPVVGILFMLAYIDRSSVGFVKLTLQDDLALSDAAFFAGSGLFFIAYALFEIPSNVFLQRVGARVWFSRIAITWGLVQTLTMFITNEWMFYAARFLLGIAEAGLYPGVIFFLSTWFGSKVRASIFGIFILANPFSFIVGNPVLGLLTGLDGTGGLTGWQWIFLITGIPPILFGIAVLFLLPSTPADAAWLSPREQQRIVELATEGAPTGDEHESTLSALKKRRVWIFSGVHLLIVMGIYGLAFWLPTVVKSFDVSSTTIGFLTTIPYIFGAIGLILIPRHADRQDERVMHAAIPLIVGGFAMAASLAIDSPAARLALMSVAAVGLLACNPMFWSMTASAFSLKEAAVAIAAVNCIGNLGGWLGPLAIGAIVDQTGSVAAGLTVIAGSATAAGLAIIATRKLVRPRAEEMSPRTTHTA